ncbi:unnamed protein product [Rotaria magnacalcarata]|uniref:S-adenosyl-L-methionine-dependent methyltransferase n=1 Tax=Rotaria magnacalcarata TaxID=392030 RepID=A0A815ZZ68_9BILA|nr:unnamed protein product [Rotaria magnacalcarata]CAF2146994.1 unnamed protein product [Rotaria magnacalcarata]CAF3897629.1 unnamed protein product [Rotaria magnacalcarata]CAF4077677.1 unnamed protein product [Rotaria magnacalcarata]
MASHSPIIDTQSSSNDDGGSLTGIPLTSLFTAAARALESSLPEDKRRFNDPYASKLAQPIMKKMTEASMNTEEDKDNLAKAMLMYKYVQDRTVYFDGAIQEYLVQHPECKQIVVLGSGMDTRAYRMGLSADMILFEIDYAHVHNYKTVILKDDEPSCQRIVVKADMTKDDLRVLLTAANNDNLGTRPGFMFDSTQATLWLAEGLMNYIPEAAVGPFVSCMNGLSAKESGFIFDGWKSRDRFSALVSANYVSYMASVAGDTLDAMNNLGWQKYHTIDYAATGAEFNTMLKQ